MVKRCLFFFIVNLLNFIYSYNLAGPNNDKIVACHFTGWGNGGGRLEILDIEPSLCTHLIYCFTGIDEVSYKIKVIDRWRDLEKDGGGFKQFVSLKEKYKHLKTTIAIGGWDEGSVKFSKMAADPKLRNIFVRSVVNFLTIHKFDGLDLHWDYPTGREGKPEDKQNYVTLVKELSEALQPNGFLLTGTIRTNVNDLDNIYDFTHVNFYLDFIHLMTYDYHGHWDGLVGANSPLRGKNDHLSLEYTIKYLIKYGLTPSKIALGIPLYGHTFILKNASAKEIVFGETETKMTAFPGSFTGVDGFIGYNEVSICLELSNKSSEWVQYWDEYTSTPYLRDDGRIISYDNPRSIANKVKFALDQGLGGFSVWHLSNDDFRGSCDEDINTFKDYMDRFNRISDQPAFQQALIILQQVGSNNEFYTISDKKPRLRLPKPKFSNYPLLRTVHEALSFAVEEKKVLGEMQRLKEGMDKGESIFPCVRTCTEVCYYGKYGKEP